MNKRLQLRGISRTPSDRMTNDGGCAESLNVEVDNQELSPAVVPEDISGSINLPEIDTGIRNFFIHKTTDYTNYILYDGFNLVFGKEEGGKYVWKNIEGFSNENERMSEITSIGNTLVVMTGDDMFYFLYKDGDYLNLGSSLPTPKIKVTCSESFVSPIKQGIETPLSARFVSEYLSEDKKVELQTAIKEKVYPFILQQYNLSNDSAKEVFMAPIFVRYAMRLYDGTYIHQSVPIYVGAGAKLKNNLYVSQVKSSGDSKLHFVFNTRYNAYVLLKNKEIFDKWKDVIQSIDIFVSKEMINPVINENPTLAENVLINKTETDSNYSADVNIDGAANTETEIEEFVTSAENSIFYLYKSYKVNGEGEGTIDQLSKSTSTDFPYGQKLKRISNDELLVKPQLPDDYQSNHTLIANHSFKFNNRLNLYGLKQRLSSGYSYLNATSLLKRGTDDLEKSNVKVEMQFFIGEKPYSVYGQYIDGKIVYQTEKFGVDQDSTWEQAYGWIVYPDQRCNKVNLHIYVDAYESEPLPVSDIHISIPMKSHPHLLCSYAYLGFGNNLKKLVNDPSVVLTSSDPIENIGNKIFQSEIENPFYYPLSARYTIGNGDIVGLSTVTRALSQGQFGQFPLYVFTTEGIWTMATTDTGTYGNSIPISREVCNSHDSITPIDQAIVFSTNRGVQLIEGSNVNEISPNMNGRHYSLESTAERLIKGIYGFCDFIGVITDKTPFMAFIKNVSSVAYDYEGRRLLFINPKEDYSYVFSIRNNTWHKLSIPGIKLSGTTNSYPSCLVVAEKKGETSSYSRILDCSTILDASKDQRTLFSIIATRPFDLDEPDVLKAIKDIRIRGQFEKTAVRFILLGSMDGFQFNVISTLRGKAWKVFRLILLTDLKQTERISWIDIEYETKFNNKLR